MTRRAHSPSASHPARSPPLPRVPLSLGLQSSVPGLRAQCQPPVNLGDGCSRLLSQPLLIAHPLQALWPRLQSHFSSGLYFYSLSVPSFLLPLWKGVPGPHAWHLPLQRRERWIFGGLMIVLSSRLSLPDHHPHSIHLALNFSLPAEVVCWSHGKKVICQDNQIHISSFLFLFVLMRINTESIFVALSYAPLLAPHKQGTQDIL